MIGASPLPRRGLLRSLGAAAGVIATTAFGAGCAEGGGRGATSSHPAPARSSGGEVLHFQVDTLGMQVTSTLTNLVQGYVDQTFNTQNPGVRAVWQPAGNLSQVAAALTAGDDQAPVVISGCCTDWPIILPFLAPIDAYLKRDNLSTGLWGQAQLGLFEQPTGLCAVPSEAVAQAYIYRQDILDALGIQYPTPDWSYQDAARIWQSCTGTVGGKHRFGGSMPFNKTGPFPGLAVLHGFGGGLVAPDGITCMLDQAGSIAAGEYAFDLLWNQVCAPGDGLPVAGIATGECVFTQGAAVSLFWAVTNLKGAKWDCLPFPRWPARAATIVQSNFYALSAAAKNPDLAWQVFRYVAVDPGFQRFMMRLSYGSPGLPSLLSEWETVVKSAAPPLRDKALQYWVDPAVAGDGFPAFEFFKYAPAEALTALGNGWGQVWNRKLGVAEGFDALTRQLGALERQAAAASSSGAGRQG